MFFLCVCLDYKEIQPVHCKRNQSWKFIGRTDAEAETPILWPPDVKIWLLGKDLDSEKDWRQEEKGTTEDEMVGWHHWLKWHQFEQAVGLGDGQGGLVCCSPWSCKESDMTEWLNWTDWVPTIVDSSPRLDFGWVLESSTWVQFPICGKRFQRYREVQVTHL